MTVHPTWGFYPTPLAPDVPALPVAEYPPGNAELARESIRTWLAAADHKAVWWAKQLASGAFWDMRSVTQFGRDEFIRRSLALLTGRACWLMADDSAVQGALYALNHHTQAT